MPQPYPGQQWKHGWIPLGPAAAVAKNHGRKPKPNSKVSEQMDAALRTMKAAKGSPQKQNDASGSAPRDRDASGRASREAAERERQDEMARNAPPPPKAMQNLIDKLTDAGWAHVVNRDVDSGGDPFITLELGRSQLPYRRYRLSWHTRDNNGKYRLFSASGSTMDTEDSTLQQSSASLKGILSEIEKHPVTASKSKPKPEAKQDAKATEKSSSDRTGSTSQAADQAIRAAFNAKRKPPAETPAQNAAERPTATQPGNLPSAPQGMSSQERDRLVEHIRETAGRYNFTGDPGRYVTEEWSNLNGKTKPDREVGKWVDSYLAANPQVVTTTAEQRQEARKARLALESQAREKAVSLSKQARAAFLAGQRRQALDLIDQAEATSPRTRDWEKIRKQIREG